MKDLLQIIILGIGAIAGVAYICVKISQHNDKQPPDCNP